MRPSRRRRWDMIGTIAGAGSIVPLLFVSAVSISHDAQVGHQVLIEHFQSRATLTASFVSGNVEDLAKREQAQATRLLSETDVSTEVFEQVVLGFGFDAAVLLDSQGRALGVWPPKPDVIGDQLADRYPHTSDRPGRPHRGVGGCSLGGDGGAGDRGGCSIPDVERTSCLQRCFRPQHRVIRQLLRHDSLAHRPSVPDRRQG